MKDSRQRQALLSEAEIIFDKFHVLQHASAALDEVRRQEFFRAGAVMRERGRGKRWLLLRRWKTLRGSKRRELQTLFAANRRLFKAYVLRERLDRLWTYKTRRLQVYSHFAAATTILLLVLAAAFTWRVHRTRVRYG